jgi:hypothetical protein
MTSFNVISSGRTQVLVDEQQLQQLQGELARRGQELERLKAAMENLSAVNAPAHFMAAAMALCNELASRWHAERVGLGFLKGRYVRLMALSHTEKITRHMQLVQDIESAMEECLDQDTEIIVPPPKDASFVYRLSDVLATRHGPSAVLSIPLRRAVSGKPSDNPLGNVVAVITLERKLDRPFTLPEIETLRLTADLFTSRLVDLYEHDRWVGAKALQGTRRALAWAVGAKHTWAKVIALAVAGLLAFACLVDGDFKVEAPFVFEASERQIVSAPFDGFLKSVTANVGDMVFTPATAAAFDDLDAASPAGPLLRVPRPPSVLATLDTVEIQGRRDEALMQREYYQRQAQLHGRENKEGERQMDLAQARGYQARIEQLEWQLDKAVIKAPVDGVIFSGDLRTKIGAPVRTGDELYEIGERDKLRAELSVPEDQISELAVNQHGQLKATTYPDRAVDFTVERITPVATVTGTKNVFKVRVAIAPGQLKNWMRPGMEGLAKVQIEKRRYGWIWTHRLVNWVRMKLWI